MTKASLKYSSPKLAAAVSKTTKKDPRKVSFRAGKALAISVDDVSLFMKRLREARERTRKNSVTFR